MNINNKRRTNQFVVDLFAEKMAEARHILSNPGSTVPYSTNNEESDSLHIALKADSDNAYKSLRVDLAHLLHYCLNNIADVDNKLDLIFNALENQYRIGIFTGYSTTETDLTFEAQ